MSPHGAVRQLPAGIRLGEDAGAYAFYGVLAAVHSAALVGIDAYSVTVEVDAAPGLPQFAIVGLPAGAVKESRERVGAALANTGFRLPPRRITVNLAPADTRKEGTAFDLPIALGILVSTGQLPAASLGESWPSASSGWTERSVPCVGRCRSPDSPRAPASGR
jgi:hypothetical protein